MGGVRRVLGRMFGGELFSAACDGCPSRSVARRELTVDCQITDPTSRPSARPRFPGEWRISTRRSNLKDHGPPESELTGHACPAQRHQEKPKPGKLIFSGPFSCQTHREAHGLAITGYAHNFDERPWYLGTQDGDAQPA